MGSYVVAFSLGAFLYSSASQTCFARHALVVGAIPMLCSLVPFLFAVMGYVVTFHLWFAGLSVLDLVPLTAAVIGYLGANRLTPHFALSHTRYWERLAAM